MQNLLGYGNTGIVSNGVIRQYVGAVQLSWVDCEDVGLVAAACLRDPAKHQAQTYRLGYDLKSYAEIAEILTNIIDKPFRYEALPAQQFLEKALAAGAEPVYMRSVYENYLDLEAGHGPGVREIYSNFEELTGAKPRLLTDFIASNKDRFAY